MNKITSQATPRQRLRIAMWHLDGTGSSSSNNSINNLLSPTITSTVAKDSYLKLLNSNSNNRLSSQRILVRRFDINERLPYISKVVDSFAPNVDALVVLGSGESVLDPSRICDTQNVYDYVCHGTSGTSFGNSFVFVPKRTSPNNNKSTNSKKKKTQQQQQKDKPYWSVEPILGVGGLHVRMKLENVEVPTGLSNSHGRVATTDSSAGLANEFVAAAKEEFGSVADEDDSGPVIRGGNNLKKEYFMDCCFLDLDGVDRSESGSRGHKQENTLGSRTVPKILPIEKDLTINPRVQPYELNYSNDSNEFRLARYFTHVAKRTDLIAGHLKQFKFDFDGSRKTDNSEEGMLKSSSPWKDAWQMAGKDENNNLTFDAPLCAKHYYDIDDSHVRSKETEQQEQRLKDFMRRFLKASRRSDKMYVRHSSKIACSDFKVLKHSCMIDLNNGEVIQNPGFDRPQQQKASRWQKRSAGEVINNSNNDEQEKSVEQLEEENTMMASCHFPVLAEFSVPVRWSY